MQIRLGEKIKQLRKRDGRKQEDLASALGVTSQAISRWEANGGYPDMEMIPAIANYFGITIDELFGYESDREQKIEALIRKSEELYHTDSGEYERIDECIALLRDGLIEFPGNEQIMLRLVVVLRDAGFLRGGYHKLWDKDGYFTPDIEKHSENPYFQEAIKLLERMNATTSGEMLYEVRYELLLLYDCVGEYTKASEIASTFPTLQLSRPAVLCFSNNGKKRAEYSEKYLLALFDELINQMISSLQLSKKNFDDNTAIEAIEKAIKMSELFFTDGNYGRFHSILSRLYLYLSSLLWRHGQKEEAFKSLDNALKHAKEFITLADQCDAHYTTPLLRHVRIECEGISCNPLTLADDWPWWEFPDTSDIEKEIKSDPRWNEWVKRTQA